MSLECSECERDSRYGHDPGCSRYKPSPVIFACYFEVSDEMGRARLIEYLSNIVGLHFVAQDGVPGTLDDVQKMIPEYPGISQNFIRK